MATLNIGGQKVNVDDSFLSLPPDQQNATVDEIASKLPKAPSIASDVVKSAPDAVVSGLTSFAGLPGTIANMGSSKPQQNLTSLVTGQPAAASGPVEMTGLAKKFNDFFGGSNTYTPGPSRYADAGDYKKAAEGVMGELYKPQTAVGKVAHASIESLSNPVSYMAPGSGVLKVAGALLSGAGGETAGQATEGTKYETAARIAGGLAGGVAAARTLGPTIERAAIPTGRELKDVAGHGYDAALQSGLTLDPRGVGSWATNVEQRLTGAGFTGGTNGTAPKTMAILGELQAPPAGSTIGASNIDALRKTLGNIAQEVNPSMGGALKPTADATAATRALEHLRGYTENIPQNHILAGDAASYASNIREANANWAAGSRAQDFDARLTKAENATDRQVSGSIDSQIKSKAGQMLDNPQRMRGMNDEERAQLQLINSGTATSNILRQLGRGGAGVIPMGAHVAAAMATGGGSIPASLAVGVPLYAARKVAEAMTRSRAADLVDMLAQRSPEYERRAAAITPTDASPNRAAIVRAILGQLGH